MNRHLLNLSLLLALPTASWGLELRVAPNEKVFLNESARRVGIRDVMLQNVAVVNDSEQEVELLRMEITA